MTSFNELNLSDDALRAVEKLGYDQPTPVQEQAIPIALEGRDLIAAASTGTGKTAAFLLPLLSNLARAGRGKRAPRVLVVTPTRELAQQIAFTCIKIARATGHFATTVYGGTPYGPQIRELRGGTDILIATPGRLKDLMERDSKIVDLSQIEALVLDEADRMLDMGFLPDVTTIVEALPEKRQTLLFSATIDQSIENNLGSLLNNPAIIQIAQKGETAKTVEQFVMPIAHRDKQDLLKAVLSEKGHERVIVFARTKMRAEEVAEDLCADGYRAESIHSDKSQGRRRRALENFRKGKTDILVATDVLARGIDVTGVDHVINLDLPDMPEDYVHRIGRTGRAGEQGYAISFVSPNSRKLLKEIEKLIDREIPMMDMDTYDLDPDLLKRGKKKGKEKRPRDRRTDRSARFKDEHSSRRRSERGSCDKREDSRAGAGGNGERRVNKRQARRGGGFEERGAQGKRNERRGGAALSLGGKKGYRYADLAEAGRRGERADGGAKEGRDRRQGDQARSRKGKPTRSKHGANHRGRRPSSHAFEDRGPRETKRKQDKGGERRHANDIRAFGEKKLRSKKAYTKID